MAIPAAFGAIAGGEGSSASLSGGDIGDLDVTFGDRFNAGVNLNTNRSPQDMIVLAAGVGLVIALVYFSRKG